MHGNRHLNNFAFVNNYGSVAFGKTFKHIQVLVGMIMLSFKSDR